MPKTFRSRSHVVTLCLVLLLAGINAPAESFRYNPVSREVVEARLGKYAGSNKQREITLKQMFLEAGCDEQHLSEQPVKGSKQPNVICLLPGTSDKVIIVAHTLLTCRLGMGGVSNGTAHRLRPYFVKRTR